MELEIKRGEIYFSKLDGGIRPVVIFQNEIANKHSPTCIVIPIISNTKYAKKIPTQVELGTYTGLQKNGAVMCDAIISIRKENILTKIGEILAEDIVKIETAMMITVGINLKENIEIRRKQENIKSNNVDIKSKEYENSIKDYGEQLKAMIDLTTTSYELTKEHYHEFKESNSAKNKYKEWIKSGTIGAIIGVIITGILALISQ